MCVLCRAIFGPGGTKYQKRLPVDDVEEEEDEDIFVSLRKRIKLEEFNKPSSVLTSVCIASVVTNIDLLCTTCVATSDATDSIFNRKMEKNFKVGDVVTLKSGGPKMTVDSYKINYDFSGVITGREGAPPEETDIVICRWFDEKNRTLRGSFPQAASDLPCFWIELDFSAAFCCIRSISCGLSHLSPSRTKPSAARAAT